MRPSKVLLAEVVDFIFFGFGAGTMAFTVIVSVGLLLGTIVGYMAKAHRVPDPLREFTPALSRLTRVFWSGALVSFILAVAYRFQTFNKSLEVVAIVSLEVGGIGLGLWLGATTVADALLAGKWKQVSRMVFLGLLVPSIVSVVVVSAHLTFAS